MWTLLVLRIHHELLHNISLCYFQNIKTSCGKNCLLCLISLCWVRVHFDGSVFHFKVTAQYTNESCHTFMYESCHTYMHASCHTYMYESCHTYMYESCHTYGLELGCTQVRKSLVTHTNESCHAHKSVISHEWDVSCA